MAEADLVVLVTVAVVGAVLPLVAVTRALIAAWRG
ncbi:hypothetical protein FB33_0278 [Cutibacterium acnes]|nr:hypothetical protein TIB1ST10_01775 [Cutibacterium acnes 6609]AER05770.1 hypothetical protein TIIST44_06445 [Cutibacterium acnes subsp. defendens ATCC 11828]AID36879.1 hypothetical protein TIA1EST1_01735 [Cutibacterium acnes hdn-1]KEY38247.1 hypothetical protein FB33_0278 [Cutibacterium acnes]